MKNATRYCTPCLLQDVLNRRLLFKTNRQQQHQRKPSPIISSFLELGRRKLSMVPKFVAAQKMLLKQKPSKHSQMDCSVLLPVIGDFIEARGIAHNTQHELPIDMGNSICTAH